MNETKEPIWSGRKMCRPNMGDMGIYYIAFSNALPPKDFRRMITNLGNTNRVGSRIIAKAIPILRPHYISDIENQAKQRASRKWPLMGAGKLKMPKSQMPLNYGRAVFVRQGN